jgi:Ca2+-binding EF-hand superfamily protein
VIKWEMPDEASSEALPLTVRACPFNSRHVVYMTEENGMFRRLLIAAVLGATPVAGPASADELADGFAEADVDGDGRLDADEYLAAVVLSFAARDEDRDGLLTSAELPEASAEGIARIDRDGDGMISVGEAAGDRIVRFFDADTDRNGLLTLAELRVYIDNLEQEAGQ